ncbi:MAG: DUF2341 domain-containing protein, partial [Verrucomicrobia bacterium]|nr:DUF2341 domain-containing protein [Verrucomicrobiota bacterium]
PLAGWAEFTTLLQPLLERDFYGKKSPNSITPPNLQKASYTTATKDTITLEFDQPVVWLDALTAQFTLPGETHPIASGSASGKVITLHLKSPSQAKTISYPAPQWNQTDLIYNPSGITALTFGDVPISSTP